MERPPRSEPAVEVSAATRPADWQAARLLVLDLAAWIREHAGVDMRSEQTGFADEVADLAAVYSAPRGHLLLARIDGVPVGSVALRRHDDGSGELKRMYVRPGARGFALGDRLVRAVLDLARRDGLRAVWLETGAGIMDPAIAIYRRHGFERRPTTDATLEHPALITMERSLLSPCA
ncbi:MAG: GNAT family N-acetyltransferase [Actinomycetota bacterium]